MNEQKLIEKLKIEYYGIIAPISLEVECEMFCISYNKAKKLAAANQILITDNIYFYNKWPSSYPIKVGIKDKQAKVVKLKDVIELIEWASSYKNYKIGTDFI